MSPNTRESNVRSVAVKQDFSCSFLSSIADSYNSEGSKAPSNDYRGGRMWMRSWLSREKSLPGPGAGLSPAAFSGWGKGEALA